MTDPDFDPLNYGQVSLDKRGETDEAEDMLFAGGGEMAEASSFGADEGPAFQESPAPAPVQEDEDDGWDPVDDSMAPELLQAPAPAAPSPTAGGVGSQDLVEQMQNAAPARRNLLPGEDDGGRGDQAGVSDAGVMHAHGGMEAVAGDRPSRRQALPSINDAPRMQALEPTAGASAWVLPLVIFLAGALTGAALILTDTNVIIGAIAAGLGLVGAPLARVLLKS